VSYGIVDNGLFVSGDGTEQAATDLGTIDGFVYAVPIAFVFRRNDASGTGGFDPVTNTNGALAHDHAGFVNTHGIGAIPAATSDRPDLNFHDVVVAGDILDLRRLIENSGHSAGIIAKIEKPEALTDIDAILDAADGIMVARGDLGVELSPEEVPVAQGQLITRARSRFKPVIVATQMLESMIENARPTRAEITDISYAVTLSTDAVMLSAESASGRYPLESVRMMDRAVRQTEAYLWKTGSYGIPVATGQLPPMPLWRTMAESTAFMSRNLNARAVLVISHSGMSAATMSSARPAAPVLALTNSPEVCRKMALLWGVVPLLSKETGLVNPNVLARETAMKLGLADTGQHILLVRGFHSDPELNTPSITVLTV